MDTVSATPDQYGCTCLHCVNCCENDQDIRTVCGKCFVCTRCGGEHKKGCPGCNLRFPRPGVKDTLLTLWEALEATFKTYMKSIL